MGLSPKVRFTPDENASANVKLDSWKEIAAYLDRDPRTVQLWEKLEGFPVHRLNHSSRASVYAYTAEIDAWIRARSERKFAPDAEEPEEQAAPPPASSNESKTARMAVRAALVLLLLTLGVGWWRTTRKPPAQPASPLPTLLAVLPFENQTSTDDSLADGLTDKVIADLGRIGQIRVISHHSVMEMKGSHLPARQVAAQLHATLLLEGTLVEVGSETRATVELLGDGGTRHLWGATYSRDGGNPIARGDQIASAIAVDVTRRVTGSVPQVVFPPEAVDPRARQDYLTAKYYWNQRELPGLQKAIALYRQALEIDPKYASAYAGLAEAYDVMTDRGVLSNSEAFSRAKAAARQALSIDSNSAEAYNALAFATYRQDWQFGRAEEEFRKALALDPDSAVAHQWYGEFLGDLRRFDESIAELRKAKELDPLSPMVGCDLADGYLHAGRLAEAEAELRRVLDLYPDFLFAHVYRFQVALHQQDFAAAQNEADMYAQRSGDKRLVQVVEIERLARAGKTAQARAVLHKLLAAQPTTPYVAAQLYFLTGQTNDGYAELEKACRQHSWWLVTMLVDPNFDGVRNQPRFLAVARRIGLPVDAGAAQTAQTSVPAIR